MVGLNVAELRRGPAVADDRPLSILFTIAEPLRQHIPAGDFVLPDSGGNVVDESFADQHAAFGFVVLDFVGH